MAEESGEEQKGEVRKNRSEPLVPGLEFLKWICLVSGIVGFITWLGDIVYWSTKGYSIHPVFEATAGGIPYVLLLFAGLLVLGCGASAYEKYLESTSGTLELDSRLDEMEKVMSEIHESLFKTTKKMAEDLKEARRLNEELRAQVEALTRERGRLNARLKRMLERLEYALAPDLREVKGIGPTMAERLRELGLEKVPDLLKISPEDLSAKLGISPKIVSKWFEEAMRLSRERSAGGSE